MACTKYLNSIQERVDGTIGAIRRAELEMHLDMCDACRALLEDLQRVHDAAAELPALAPPDRAWLQIAGRLRLEGRITDDVAAAPPSRRAYVAWLAIAAALVIAAGSAVLLLVPRGTPAAPPQAASSTSTASDGAAVEAVNAVEAAQAQFEKAIEDLEKVAKANQQALDPSTAATIEKNLGIIDQAIADNRVAVKSEPASVAARETLFEALRQKVTLLQNTISLINEMRKGNNAAAAQLVNKS
jgi:tetratricopeptide (TPR) repeat protein